MRRGLYSALRTLFLHSLGAVGFCFQSVVSERVWPEMKPEIMEASQAMVKTLKDLQWGYHMRQQLILAAV